MSEIEEEVNRFMAKQARIYNVKHSPILDENGTTYHYIMVSYEQ